MPPAEAREMNGMGGPLVGQVPSLDIEDPQREQNDAPDGEVGCVDRISRCLFPIEDIFDTPVFKYGFCCCIMPGIVKAMIPSTTRRIQGWTHLALIIGIAAAACLVVRSAFYIFPTGNDYTDCYDSLCGKEALMLIFVTPVLVYFLRCINQFDQRMQEKTAKIEEQKKELVSAFNTTISDLDSLLTQSTESSSGLAERNFQSKKRDFERFLKTMKSQGSQLRVGSQAEMEQLCEQFKKMITNWLKVFQECSCNPTGAPLVVIKDGELDHLGNIIEIVDLVLDRLKVNDVRFISAKRDQDKKMIEGDRKEVRSFTNEDVSTKPWYRKTIVMRMKVAKKRVRMPAWISCCSGGSGNPVEPLEDGFPRELSCGCCSLILLSREHLSLMLGMIIGWVVIAYDVAWTHGELGEISWAVIIWMSFVEMSIILLLARFEEVDAIQTLEREVRQLKARTDKVQKESEEIKLFWEEVQQIADIWLYRTVPRLDLHKEIHVLLEDTKDGKALLNQLTNANKGLEYVETSIGEVNLWHGQGQLTKDTKQGFGTTINKLCRQIDDDQDMNHIMNLDMKRITGERKSMKPLELKPP